MNILIGPHYELMAKDTKTMTAMIKWLERMYLWYLDGTGEMFSIYTTDMPADVNQQYTLIWQKDTPWVSTWYAAEYIQQAQSHS